MLPGDQKIKVLGETLDGDQTVQLLETEPGVLYLRRRDTATRAQYLSGPLFSDAVALLEARDLFPGHLPWGALPVDSG